MGRELLFAYIMRRIDHTPDLATFVLKTEPRDAFSWLPRQYCTIGIDDGKGGIVDPRPYSIVSCPEDGVIELFVELVPPPDGNLTPKLWALKEYDHVRLLPKAKGKLLFEPAFRNHVMVATVTGIAPFLAMLWRHFREQTLADHRFLILHGARYQDELTSRYRNELSDLATLLPDQFCYVPAITKPDEERNRGFLGAVGRLPSLLEGAIASRGFVAEETIVYLCGNPDMIVAAKTIAERLGCVTREEQFWKPAKEALR